MSIAAGSVGGWALLLALLQSVLGCAAPAVPAGSRVAPAGLIGIPANVLGRREGLRSLIRAADEVEVLQGGVGTAVERLHERPAEVEAVLRGLLRSIRAMHENRYIRLVLYQPLSGG